MTRIRLLAAVRCCEKAGGKGDWTGKLGVTFCGKGKRWEHAHKIV